MQPYTIVKRSPLFIIGIECRTSNHPEAGPQDIPRHWERFYRENIFEKIPNKASKEVLALYCDYEGDYTKPYSLVIGCPVTLLNDIPDGMVGKTLPASSYALYKAIGEYPQSLINTWGAIWQSSLDRTYSGDFEVYGDAFTLGNPKEVEVLITIAEESGN